MSTLLSGLASCTGVCILQCASGPLVVKSCLSSKRWVLCFSWGSGTVSEECNAEHGCVLESEWFQWPACFANIQLC